MSVSEYLSPLIGRLVFAWFFFVQVFRFGGDWEGTISLMRFEGVPSAPLVLAIVLLLLIMGSFSLALGFHTRHGAVLLFAITVVAAVIMHPFWRIADNATARDSDFELFAYSMAVAGGLLLLVGMGPGPLAFDNPPKKKK